MSGIPVSRFRPGSKEAKAQGCICGWIPEGQYHLINCPLRERPTPGCPVKEAGLKNKEVPNE